MWLLMCGIFASFSLNTLKKLAQLNAYRGQHSHSLALFNYEQGDIEYLTRQFGPFKADNFEIPKGKYAIGHIQAPTTENTGQDFIHPAIIENSYLWHNGILKPQTIKALQHLLNSDNTWDTKLLLQFIIEHRIPSDIDGSFACMMVANDQLYVFRNELSPLFYSPEFLDFSSSPFEGAVTLPPNRIFGVGLEIRELCQLETFTTVGNPYEF
jgi:glutamine phosphoribosylpyrophosphate amidotransferase